MKIKRDWSNSDMRSVMRGEAMHYFSGGQHYYVSKDWYDQEQRGRLDI